MKKKTKLMVGLLCCMVILAGCTIYEELIEPDDCCVWLDEVYLTEQEAIDTIRGQLVRVGLFFDEVPQSQSYSVQVYSVPNGSTVQLVLVNEEMDLRIALVDHWYITWSERNSEEARLELTENAKQQFEDEFKISVDFIFFNPIDELAFGSGEAFEEQEERRVASGIAVEEDLARQIQNFIEQLQEEGIVD